MPKPVSEPTTAVRGDSVIHKSATIARHGKRVRITDLAEALGLTKGTVSRALNGYTDISETTRTRVRRAAQKMGYTPMPYAQAVKTGRVRALGLVLELDAHDKHSPFLTDFLAGVTQAASAEGWTLTVATARYGADMRATVTRLVQEQKADGFILPRTRVRDDRVEFMAEQHIPFVLYGRTGFGGAPAPYPYFDVNGEGAMRAAVRRLYDQGHRRIGFVGFSNEFNFNLLRHSGYLAGLADCGLPQDAALIRFGAMQGEDGAQATLDLMRQPLPPTGIIFATDEAALGAYDAARELGLRIGTDLSVVSYDGIPRGHIAVPPLTSYAVDTLAAGARLAHLLISHLRGGAAESLQEISDAVLYVGGSDGPPASTSNDLAKRLAGQT